MAKRNRPTNPVDDGVLTSRPGTIDADTSFERVMSFKIEAAIARLRRFGFDWEADGGFVGIMAKAPRGSRAFHLARAATWLQTAAEELDPNRRLNFAYQAGWEMAAAKAGRVFGDDVVKARKQLTDAHEGAARKKQNRLEALDREDALAHKHRQTAPSNREAARRALREIRPDLDQQSRTFKGRAAAIARRMSTAKKS